jgi:peptide chain release factor subunit 1
MTWRLKVGEVASAKFKEQKDLRGVVIGGPGPIKEQFTEGDFLNYKIKKLVVGIVNTSYTGEYGLRETVERADEIISEASIVRERKILERFFEEFGKDSGLAVYGFKEVVEALDKGNLEIMIISEEHDWIKAGLECPQCGFKTEKVLNKKQADNQHCPECNSGLSLISETLLTEELIKRAEQMATSVEVVSTGTGMGEQIKELGGIVGILRYKS